MRTTFLFLAFCLLSYLTLPLSSFSQDYVMYETMYVKIKSGHTEAFAEEVAEHNKAFHAEGAYSANMYSVVNGPRSGQLLWVMGPLTFSDMDNRPGGDDHFRDWNINVLSHCNTYNREFWVMNNDISYLPEPDGVTRPLMRIRYFDVTDNALFVKLQGQISAVSKDRGGASPRVMFQNRFMSPGTRDWIVVSFAKNWAELDEENPSFMESFRKVHGEDSWDTFIAEFEEAVESREDEWMSHIPRLSGPQAEGND